ncbi:16S rRNA (guanine(966)-N(2))-methyltransferase RsmD [Tyzzerella sp. An114]|uniref:16S rRNA (guanine(966)-N(2))-methyltransferase RsmD n=1 Tax=Tyzzerella sp. An114 TaxID=1965545 RepID=UPI000B4408EB|nr:16S rRNA (guanine(966)-N(2))-methyltransferase RsmD [Tyzzerella sp. An114]OUQ58866.1 16S rRNA (guanine(966)-N(2))-methyltransferase RsmD [Tyzzerella sp. An114]
MRVISGMARGHKLLAPEGMDTRPTTDRIKETLFNIIAPDLPQSRFLDLFSGSGAIGIEALSRGAQKAVFVDESSKCREIIEHNLKHTKLIDNADLYCMDAVSAINMLGTKGEKFDIIFLDPPYNMGFYEPVIIAIKNSGILDKEGYIIAERSPKVSIHEIEGITILREKEYKTTVMTFMALED